MRGEYFVGRDGAKFSDKGGKEKSDDERGDQPSRKCYGLARVKEYRFGNSTSCPLASPFLLTEWFAVEFCVLNSSGCVPA